MCNRSARRDCCVAFGWRVCNTPRYVVCAAWYHVMGWLSFFLILYLLVRFETTRKYVLMGSEFAGQVVSVTSKSLRENGSY